MGQGWPPPLHFPPAPNLGQLDPAAAAAGAAGAAAAGAADSAGAVASRGRQGAGLVLAFFGNCACGV
jgi:hypothetical protein